ncbi:MAG: adenylate/guanylate cyclase domain-containing protein [Dehalococcoidia bacterium]|nr:adenylate/guanylate cyclase domain-containing protein [Dehalococcoidia bacterium]
MSFTTTTRSAGLEPGRPIITEDGKPLGRVKDVSPSGLFFLVDVPRRRDYWLSADDVSHSDSGGIHLKFRRKVLEERHALRLSRDTIERLEAPGRERPTTEQLCTVLFTDVEEHTAMMGRLGDVAGRALLREHERIIRDALRTYRGTEIKTMGDGFLASFGSTFNALQCAAELQRAFHHRNLIAQEPLRVRVGLNAGEPIIEEDDIFGMAVIAAARIAGQARGGEILASLVVRELAAGKGFLFADRGETVLHGFDDPVRIFELHWQPEET